MQVQNTIRRHFTAISVAAYCLGLLVLFVDDRLQGRAIFAFLDIRITQYFVNYSEHAFARRGLVGSVLSPLLSAMDNPLLVANLLAIALNTLFFLIILTALRRFLAAHSAGSQTFALFLSAAFALGSLGFIQFAHDVGRLDYLNYVLMGLCMMFANQRRALPLAVLLAVGVLVHEAFFIYAVPAVLAVYWRRLQLNGSAQTVAATAAVLLPALTAALAVYLYGNAPGVLDLPYGYGQPVWARDLFELSLRHPLWQYAVFIYGNSVLVLLLLAFYRQNQRRPDLAFFAALTPLSLYLFGIDYGRWLAVEFIVVIGTICTHVVCFNDQLPNLSPRLRRAALIFCLPLGPIGSVGAFAYLPF